MRIHLICCQVFYREISALCAVSPHITTVSWLPQGLHDTPELLRKSVTQEINRVENWKEEERRRKPDYIVLGYGLCSNGTVGLQSGEIPLVIPRTDDCIGIFLGSQKRYLRLFAEYPGTYWLNNGWIESAFIPTEEQYSNLRKYYEREYGEENADFLMESALSWIKNYRNCGYIESAVYRDPSYRETAKQMAQKNGWTFHQFDGDNAVLQKMVNGPYDTDTFLICPPYHRVVACYDGCKFDAAPLEEKDNILPKR